MKNADAICLVLTTWPEGDPAPLARALVDARLAACVHVFETGTSIYRWEGAVETARERQVAIKTTRGTLGALEALVRARHTYTVPEWLVIEATAAEAYGRWIRDAVGAAGPGAR